MDAIIRLSLRLAAWRFVLFMFYIDDWIKYFNALKGVEGGSSATAPY